MVYIFTGNIGHLSFLYLFVIVFIIILRNCKLFSCDYVFSYFNSVNNFFFKRVKLLKIPKLFRVLKKKIKEFQVRKKPKKLSRTFQ